MKNSKDIGEQDKMRQLIILTSILFVLLVSAGCQTPGLPANNVDVVIDGDGQFPEFLVGRWQADEGGWEIVFEPDGSISSAVHSMGKTSLRPGQTTEVPTKKGGKAVYKTGKWTVQYAQDGNLAVEIVLEYFSIQMGPSALKGSITDSLIGPVFEENETWTPFWSTYPEYKVFSEEFPEGKELPLGPDDHDVGALTFTKID